MKKKLKERKEDGKDMYNPLPKYLSIGPSDIDGVGIFALEAIPEEIVIGITHIYDTDFENDYIRTPLGGFLNHSDNPNCKLIDEDEYKRLVTIEHIEAGTELTVKYTMYDLNND